MKSEFVARLPHSVSRLAFGFIFRSTFESDSRLAFRSVSRITSRIASRLTRVCALFILGVLGIVAAVHSEDIRSEKLPPEDVSLLPVGSAPEALDFSWFPNKTCAVVWRNWNLVEIETLAATLKTDARSVAALAERLGLPAYRKPSWTSSQIYISLLRRSWHLLPYEQLLTLTGMTAKELAFHLREDDFLFIKLGSLKPTCEPVVFEEPDPAELKRWREAVGTEYSGFHGVETPRFDFMSEFQSIQEARIREAALNDLTPNDSASNEASSEVASPAKSGTRTASQSGFDMNYVYSYAALFGDPLADETKNPFPDGLLEKLRDAGVTGVWLHIVLRDLAPGGETFPEFGAGRETRLQNLRRLVERAGRFGISVFLYLNEPRGELASFFEKSNRSQLRGARENDFYALCVSQPAVRKWLGDSLAYVFREVPDLGGVFSITASENFTNCASHGKTVQATCPICSQRSSSEIIAEVNSVIEEGVHRSAPDAKVIVWDWGWDGHGVTPEIIRRLPKNVYLMSVSEWSIPIVRGGISSTVGEYSLSAVGPGPRAQAQWKLAQEAGLKTAAKIQLGTTWEFAAVPYVPVLELAAEHCRNLALLGVKGLMSSWSLGGYPSPNLGLPAAFNQETIPSVDDVLNRLAAERYGANAATQAREAWKVLSRGYQEFPYHIGVAYCGPQQMGPANPLYAKPTRYAATMVGIPYDDLGAWRACYPPEVFVSQMRKTAEGMLRGAEMLEKLIPSLPEEKRAACAQDCRYARCAGIHFASVANQAEWVALRGNDEIYALSMDAQKRLLEILDDEIVLAQMDLALVREDSRIGFESTNHYWFTPQDLVEKIAQCRLMKSKLNTIIRKN